MQLLCGEQAYGLERAEKLKLSPNTISHHMSKLQKCGLVISSFEGNRVYYRANKAAVDEFIRMLSKKLRVKYFPVRFDSGIKSSRMSLISGSV